MTDDRKGGIALIAGTATMIVTMLLHPSGRDLFVPGRLEQAARLVAVAHALGIASMPISFLGALALTRRLASPDRLALAALVVYGLALVAGMVAAVASGFVAPSIAREMIDAVPQQRETWEALFHFNGAINQAFARVLVAASSIAIVLWSAAIVKHAALSRRIGIYGLIAGLAIVLVLASGHLRLDVHGFGLVVLAQAVWFITAGIEMGQSAA